MATLGPIKPYLCHTIVYRCLYTSYKHIFKALLPNVRVNYMIN